MNTAIVVRSKLELIGRKFEQVQREWSEHVIDMRRSRELIEVQWLVCRGAGIEGINNACARALERFAAISNIIKKGTKALERFGPILTDHEELDTLQEYFENCFMLNLSTETREWQLRNAIIAAQHHLAGFEYIHQREESWMFDYLAKLVSEQRKLLNEAHTPGFLLYCQSSDRLALQLCSATGYHCDSHEPAHDIDCSQHDNQPGSEASLERRMHDLMRRMAKLHIKMARQTLLTQYFPVLD